MALRNALVIAYYFPPMGLSGVQRTLKFCKYMPGHGWNPIVLTTSPQAYYAFDDGLASELGPDALVYRTAPDISRFAARKRGLPMKYPSYLGQKIKKALLQTVFQPDSRRMWKKHAVALGEKIINEHKIDVIYATAPPFTDFLVAYELSKKYNIPFITDYRDLWVDNAFYFYATPFHKSYSIRLESKVLTYAEKSIVTSRYMKERMLMRYKFMSHNDITIIPHGYDSEDFLPWAGVRPDRNMFTITHSGLFPDDLTPKYFLKALAIFLKRTPSARAHVEARFIGLLRNSHKRLIRRLKLEGVVKASGYLPHSEAVKNLMESDVLWMMITNEIATPSRLYEYIGAMKPILICAPEGNIRQAALDTKAATATGPKDTKAIAAAIEELYGKWRNGGLPRPDKAYAGKFDRGMLTRELARELSLAAKI